MSHRIRPSQIAALDPVVHRPKAPDPVRPLPRTLEPLGDSMGQDVVWLSPQAQALMSAEAAQSSAPVAPMARGDG